MPKPLLLRRPSGLYARYWVPTALRLQVGSSYIVRSLGGLRGDAARLEAARLGYALAHEFATLKRRIKPRMTAPPSAMLGERIDVYLREHPSADRPLRLFLAWVGNKALVELSATDIDTVAGALHHWPKDAGRMALFKDASPHEVIARAKRARSEPISPQTWRKYLATVRAFGAWLIARGELDQTMDHAFYSWLGPRVRLRSSSAPVDVTAHSASYTVDTRLDGSMHIHADTEEDHQHVLDVLDRIQRPPSAASSGKAVRTLGEARDLFLVQFKEKNPAPATLHETVATLGLFLDIVGPGKPMNEVGVDEVDTLRAALALWPERARVRPEYKALSTRDIIKKAKRDKPRGIGMRTKDKHLDNVRKFFTWAMQRHEMTHNPLAGVRLQTKAQKATRTRRGFTVPELAALFSPHLRASHAATPSYFWLPVLALHTGARLRELAQLRVVDVHEVSGVWGVDINYHAGPLKNPQSQRFVPLASAVLALGFLDYVADVRASGFDRVFPDGSWSAKNGPGDKVSKWFNRAYTRTAGLVDPALVFHSFRHTFADTADGVGLTEAQIGALTGHQSATVLGQHYIRSKTMPVRRQHVDTIASQFALPALDTYAPGQFAAAFTELKKKQARTAAVTARVARQNKKINT
ncbi:tyrosine-type recombinase/integrase [Rhodanobacter denitrificans]|nr:tyrosine-type recombinase/integrase [Rhodanobacter denitrificans]